MAHLTRYYMYNKLKEHLKEPLKGTILGVSGISNFCSLIDTSNSNIIEVSYPAVDMQQLPYQNDVFDFVISDQVIEHIEQPGKAISESYRVLKAGGLAIHTTCFINYIHCCPNDFWRFSPDALRLLCRDFSEILCCEAWGNRLAIILCLLSDKFRYAKIRESRFSILRLIAKYNEERYPIHTWVVAKK
jgi:ubiquinone/menaquinone biosynthesis C-methylase UbiE